MPGPTVTQQRQRIVDAYRESGRPWPASSREIAIWAIDHSYWEPGRASLVARLADELSRAMREEYFTDPQGRVVRTKHAARTTRNGIQGTFWDDIRTAHSEHMRIAFQQRRQQIVGDCRQLKADVDSFNENRLPERPIQLILDFTDDVSEAEALDGLSLTTTADPADMAAKSRSSYPEAALV